MSNGSKIMEEKERYEYYLGTNSIKDNKTNQIYDYVVDLLNQQHKELSKLRASYQQVKEENSQLKQSQKQLAVEELEKLKDFFLEPYRDEEMDTDFLITKDAGSIADYVLDRIKELGGGENE